MWRRSRKRSRVPTRRRACCSTWRAADGMAAARHLWSSRTATNNSSSAVHADRHSSATTSKEVVAFLLGPRLPAPDGAGYGKMRGRPSILSAFPDDLPVPEDDGACDHLVGTSLPAISLPSTAGGSVDLGHLRGRHVLYCYPRTGQP